MKQWKIEYVRQTRPDLLLIEAQQHTYDVGTNFFETAAAKMFKAGWERAVDTLCGHFKSAMKQAGYRE